MNISGVLIHVQPENISRLTEELNAMPGVEIHAAENGKLVVTAEHEKLNTLADIVMSFQHLKGVMSVAMVYHESDDSEDINIDDVLAEVSPACSTNTCDEQSLQEVL